MNNSTFGEILTGLLTEKGVNAKDFAEQIGVTSATVSTWRSDEHGIELSNLVAICKYFGCSLDYLVGKSFDDKPPARFEIPNFGTRVREIMFTKNVSSYKFRKETRFGSRQHYWDKGAEPKLSTLVELSDYFGCTLDELIGFE